MNFVTPVIRGGGSGYPSNKLKEKGCVSTWLKNRLGKMPRCDF